MNLNSKQIQILDSAEKLFAEKGFSGTSVRDIADAAGVNIAMISYYFRSKEKLMQAIFEERIKLIREQLESLLHNKTLDPFEKLYRVADDYIDRILEKKQFHKIMIYEQMMQKNHLVTVLLNQLKKQNASIIEKIIAEGQQKKIFRKEVDPLLIINTMTGVVMQTIFNEEYYREYHGISRLSPEAYRKHMKKKLGDYIKVLFKAILQYEEK